MKTQDEHRYDDIIHLPHPELRGHPRMSAQDRAAQFAPFAALTGHEEAIRETARLTESRRILSEERIAVLNEKLQILAEHPDRRDPVSITYFLPDKRKEGGAYITHTGIVHRIDSYERTVNMEDGTVIPIGEISEIII